MDQDFPFFSGHLDSLCQVISAKLGRDSASLRAIELIRIQRAGAKIKGQNIISQVNSQ